MTVLFALAALAAPGPVEAPKACERSCRTRVQKRVARKRWRRAVQAYGPGLLAARRRCETGSHGTYALSTTGNSYWYAYQHDVAAWAGAGGRVRHGRPVGVWTVHPSPLEQDYRAVKWDRIHGGDAWPNCP